MINLISPGCWQRPLRRGVDQTVNLLPNPFDVFGEIASRHAANLSARSTSRPTISANRTGTAFPNCRIVSDHEPWNT